MSNRPGLSNARNALHDLQSDLRGIELQIISISAAGNVGRAIEALQQARSFLTDALAENVDIAAANVPNALPESFSIREAFDILKWQGSRQGLARHLEADGYVRALRHDAGSRTLRHIWRRRPIAPPPCACRCHTGTCGANDMDLAERTVRLIERVFIADAEAIGAIDEMVSRAGVEHAQVALKRIPLDDDVPF